MIVTADMWSFLYDNIRWVSVVVFTLAIALMTWSMILRGRSKTQRRIRRVFLSFYLLLANAVYASGYSLAHNLPPTPAAVTTAFTALVVFLSLLWRPAGDDLYPPEDNAWSTRMLAWLDRLVVRLKHRRG